MTRRPTPGSSSGAATMFVCCFAALGLLWMPLALFRQIDAFLGFLTPLQLARDVALAYLVLLLPALLFASVGGAVGVLLRRLGVASAGAWAWAVVLMPTLWICIWQLGGTAWAWLKTVGPAQLNIGYGGRLMAAAALLMLLGWVLHRRGLRHLIDDTVARLASLRGPALFLLLPAVVLVALMPPRLATTPAPANTAAVPADRPDIYLITIDTLAEVDAQVCGSGATLMPRLREFAASATCFQRHYTNSNYTTPSTSTLETGLLPWHHWAVQFVAQIAEPLQKDSMATQLRAAGYETHSINANLLASPRRHGTQAGWDSQRIARSTSLGHVPRAMLTLFSDTTLPYWLSSFVPLLDTIDIYLHGEQQPYLAEYAYRDFLQSVDTPPASGRPRFYWVHTLPPHDPYLPPPETKYRLLPKGTLDRWSEFRGMGDYAPEHQGMIDKYRLRYRESVMGADASLGRLFDELKQRGRLDKAVVIISSDHGELFERGFLGHAGERVHNPVLQIPLVVRLPGQTEGRQVAEPVSLVDLPQTIAELAGTSMSPNDGQSLRPALEGKALPPRPVYVMAMEQQSRFAPLRAGHYVIIDGNDKLVLHLATGRTELYDLRSDPEEQQDLSSTEPDKTRRLRSTLEAQLTQAEQRRAHLFGSR
jgi:arylsulfatase A-like enzyme